MVPWIKLSVLALLVVLPAQGSPSGHKEVEVLRSSSDRTPSRESGDHEAVESQQVSLITTIEYLPVEAKKIKPEEHGSDQSKAEESEDTAHTRATTSYKDSVDHKKGDKDAVWVSHKEGHPKRGNKRYKAAGHKRSHSSAGSRAAKGHKGHAVGHKGHKNKGNNEKNDHQHREYGDKLHSEAGGAQDKIHKKEKSYSHREDDGHETKYQKKGGHEGAHGSSIGDRDHEGYENVDKLNNSGDFGDHGSQSRLRPIKVVVRKRKLGPVKSDKKENPVKEASDNVFVGKETPKEEPKYGEKKRKKKNRARPTTRESTKPSEKVLSVQKNRRLRRIRNKNPSTKESTSKKVLLKRRINNALHGSPVSVFVRKEDLDKLKSSKVGRGKYAGHIAHPKKKEKGKKHVLYEENNEITNDDAEENEKATTVEKPVVVAKSVRGSYSSKEDTSAHVIPRDKPHVIPILRKEKAQQVSVVSDVSMEHSSTGKESKPKSYKNSKAHKAVHFQAAGKKVAKGESQSSGYKGNHHGDYGKDHNSKFYDKGAKEGKGHKHQKQYGGHYKAGKKASKGHAHGTRGYHQKGHNDKGFKNVHHKLEYSSKKNFYHDDEDKKYHNAFNDFDAYFAKKMKNNLEDHKFYDGDHHNNYGHSGSDFDKLFEEHKKGYQDMYSHHGYYDTHHHHGNKKKHKKAHHYHHDHHWK